MQGNPNPSPETRFGAGHRANPNGGRTPSKWLREYLSAARDKTEEGTTRRRAIAEHLFEVATSWKVRVVGRDSDGELLKVASARDAVEAAKLLMSYDMGLPTKGGTVPAPSHAPEGASTLDLLMLAYRERLLAGELAESEMSTLAALLLGVEKTEAEILAKLMGGKAGAMGALKDKADKLLERFAQSAGLPPIEAQATDTKPPEGGGT